jgi:hypothetical protein
VSGSSEAVQAKPRAFPFSLKESGQTHASVTDYARTQKWRCLNVIKVVGQMVSKSGGSFGIFCIATID